MRKIIILDRDGVINYDSDDYVKSPAEWRPIPGSLEAIAALNRSGFTVAIATNQAAIARGIFDDEMLAKIHEKMQNEVRNVGGLIHKIVYCPHDKEDHCECRKPKPGMLYEIANYYDVSLKDTFFVGDKYSDIQAGKAAQAQPILVKTGYGKDTLKNHPQLAKEILCFPDFKTAVHAILKESSL